MTEAFKVEILFFEIASGQKLIKKSHFRKEIKGLRV